MLIVDINSQNIEAKCGVYKIYSPDFICSRILGQDSTGLLYIGKSRNLKQRLNNLRKACDISKSITPSVRGEIHVFSKAIYNLIESGENFLESNPYLNPNRFEIEYTYTDDHSLIETKLLNEYLLLFGEVPPFNFKR